MSPQSWLLSPRDPLVLGEGLPVGTTSIQRSAELPSPGALSGYVRARWLETGGVITDDRVRQAVDALRVRGPWLVWSQPERHGGGATSSSVPAQPWVAAAAPTRLVPGQKSTDIPINIQQFQLVDSISNDVGGLGPDLPLLVRSPERLPSDPSVKLARPRMPYQPLDLALGLALGEASPPHLDAWLSLQTQRGPVTEERRTHVAIDDDAGTAEDAQLFGSSGSRYAPGAAIGFEVHGLPLPSAVGVEVLGGESRPSTRSPSAAPVWWEWSSVERRYRDAIHRLAGRSPLLRLQLVTPGCFGGWRPPDLDGLTLVAAAVPGFQAISGWDLKAGRQRPVRRLVPPGAVYWYRPDDASALIKHAERLWHEPLPGVLPDAGPFLSKPEHDGYGQVLPGFEPAP